MIAGSLARLAAGLLLLAAVSGVYWGTKPAPRSTPAGTLWLVADVSRSMLCRDVPDGRLAAARSVLGRAAEAAADAEVGLIAYAGGAALLVPPTTDRQALAAGLAALSIDAAPPGGSELPAAWELLMGLTPTASEPAAVALVLVSDGGHEPWPIESLTATARARGWRLLVIGIGDPEQFSPIPSTALPLAPPLLRGGEPVSSQLREEPLRALAEQAGGVYLPLRTGPARLPADFAGFLPPPLRGVGPDQPIDRYWPLVLAAWVMLVLAWSGRGKWQGWPPGKR